MADKKTRRREKKQAKSRVKSKEKSQALRARRKATGGTLGVEKAANWPTHEAYVSENWHEQGPRVHAIFSRARDDGRLAAAIFEVDLMTQGVIEARLELDWTVPHLQRAVVERSEALSMVTCAPDLIVKIVEEGRRHGLAEGHKQPQGLALAQELFGDVSAEQCTYDVFVGDTPPEKSKKSGGVLDSLKRAFVRR